MSSLPSIPLPNFSTWTWRGWHLTRMVQRLKRGSQHHPFLKRYETVIVMQMQNDLRVSKWFCHGNETYPLLWPQGTVLLCHWTLCKTEHNFWVRVLELSDRIFSLGPIQDLCLGPGCVNTFPLETISYSCSLCKQFFSCRFQVFWKISLDSYSRLDSKRTIRSSCSIIATKRAFQCL